MAERAVGHGSFGIVFQVISYIHVHNLLYARLTLGRGGGWVGFGRDVWKFLLPNQCTFNNCIASLILILQAKCLETGETVAIKKVLQDKRYKNRELQTMRLLDHPNVVSLKHCFFSTTEKDELYLNLVLEYVPETVYRVGKHYSRANQRMPLIYVKLYTYQVKEGYPLNWLYEKMDMINIGILCS